VLGLASSGGGRGGLSTNVVDHPIFVSSEGSLESRLNVSPCSLIFVFFLTEDQLCIAVLVSDCLDNVEWERADLLDGVDGDLVLQTSVTAALHQVVVNFSSAENDLLDSSFVLTGRSLVQEHSLEFSSLLDVVKR